MINLCMMKTELRTRHFRHALTLTELNTHNDQTKYSSKSQKYMKHNKSKQQSRLKFFVVVLPLLLCIVSTWTRATSPFLSEKNVKPRIVLLEGTEITPKQYISSHRENSAAKKLAVSDDSRSNVSTVAGIRNKSIPCVPLVEWQEYSFPTCNILHEIHLMSAEYTNSGMNRDVWMIKDANSENVAMKTLAMQHSFSRSMINKQRIDAIVSERSTSLESIVNIFAYCKFRFHQHVARKKCQ
mmetsp:Transcript_16878/g.31966  ORF Transcript_16878/g.31966 Transcript_16878/m.31966 type:complete len:240 (-) Transcript_16878:5253-5972(-)